MLNDNQRVRNDIDDVGISTLTKVIDDFPSLKSPFSKSIDLDNMEASSSTWYKNEDGNAETTNFVRNDVVRFWFDYHEMSMKNIENLSLVFNISTNHEVNIEKVGICNFPPSYTPVKITVNDQTDIDVTIDISEINNDDIISLIEQSIFGVFVELSGGLINSNVIISDISLVSRFTSLLDDEIEAVKNRLQLANINIDTYSKEEVDTIVDDIVSGGVDLTGYVKTTDLNSAIGDIETELADKIGEAQFNTSLNEKANLSHNHGNLKSDGKVTTTNNTNKNVVTDNNGYITVEDKPFIPTKTSDLTNDSNFEVNTNKTSSWNSTTNNTRYPSEKLVKDSLDLKSNTTHTHNSWIAYGKVDSSSTSTAFTATVPDITELKDGIAVMLRNGKVTSASGFTLNVNGLGAKPVYSSMHDVTRDTTIFNVNYTMLFVYDTTRVENGCWICYRGYDSNTNTIGYQLRTNSTQFTTLDKTYRYRLMLQGVDGNYFPVNTSTSDSANTDKSSTINTRQFIINGDIRYYSATATVNANAKIGAATMWQQYILAFGYSFNNTGRGLSLTAHAPIYMVAEPMGKGLAKLKTPYYTQTLPNSEDGLLYIQLGYAYSTTQIELMLEHPVFEYKDNAVRTYRDYYTTAETTTELNKKENLSNKITSWNTTANHTNYPSEKLVKDEIDAINRLIGNAIYYINL